MLGLMVTLSVVMKITDVWMAARSDKGHASYRTKCITPCTRASDMHELMATPLILP